MKLPTLTEIVRGETPWIINGLVAKGQSFVLSGSDAKATALLALQIALDVAAGKDFLGKYSTYPSKVLFFDTDKTRVGRDAKTLTRTLSATNNVVVGPGNEQDFAKLVKEEQPDLTVLRGENGTWNSSLAALGSVLLVTGNTFSTDSPDPNLWVLNAKTEGYALQLRSFGTVLNLKIGANGFVLESVEALKAGERPVFPTKPKYGKPLVGPLSRV